jgi:predicted phosphodiesterase
MVVPHLRGLACPLVASFGDNEGNRVGLRGGLRIVGEVADPPFGFRTRDGVRVLVTHQLELLRRDYDGADLVIYGHTHKPNIRRDDAGRWFVNPGETSGWTYRRPTVALVETDPLSARLIELPPLPDVPQRQINRSGRSR